MFKRKLIALDHQNPETVNFDDEASFRALILWLEDQKIRHYKIEDREPLRHIENPEWTKSFHRYIQDLNCPYQPTERRMIIDWFLGYAIRLEYGDNVEKCKDMTAEIFKESQANAKPLSTNPLDNMDFDSPDFKAGIISLASLLQVPPHPDHKEQLKAICLLIRDKFSKEAIASSGKTNGKIEVMTLEKMPLGFDSGDYISNDAAKILRLLHITELRDLQTAINEAIVAVQAITANPKTDQRLGKVGR